MNSHLIHSALGVLELCNSLDPTPADLPTYQEAMKMVADKLTRFLETECGDDPTDGK